MRLARHSDSIWCKYYRAYHCVVQLSFRRRCKWHACWPFQRGTGMTHRRVLSRRLPWIYSDLIRSWSQRLRVMRLLVADAQTRLAQSTLTSYSMLPTDFPWYLIESGISSILGGWELGARGEQKTIEEHVTGIIGEMRKNLYKKNWRTLVNRIHCSSWLDLAEANTDLLQSLANVFMQLAAPSNACRDW